MTAERPTIRLAFNARLLQFADTRGWNRYAASLLAELPALGVEPVLYTDRPLHPDQLARLGRAGESVRVSPRMPYPAWEQGWLPLACGLDRVDLLHSPFHFGLPWASPCPPVLTLLDAIDRALGGRPRGDYRSRFHQRVARSRARRIITVGEHTRVNIIQDAHPTTRSLSSIRAGTRGSASNSARRCRAAFRRWRPGRPAFPRSSGRAARRSRSAATAPLAGLIRRVAADPAYRDELSSRARARAAGFSWRKTAESTVEVYRGLLAGRSLPQGRVEIGDLGPDRVVRA